MKRGTSLDSYIPGQTKLAVQWIERNYTFTYMEVFRLLQLVTGDRIVPMPKNVAIKSVKFIRLINLDGTYGYLKSVGPQDLMGLRANTTVPAGNDVVPRAYFRIGLSQLVLDAVPDTEWSGEAIFYEYTDWPTDLATQHPLLSIAADVLLAQVQLFMAVNILKDDRMAALYKATRDEGLNTLTRAEDETAYGGTNESMVYAPFQS